MRTVRVDDRRALAIAVMAGLAASFGPSPTGLAAWDVVVTTTAVTAAVWAAAAAPWWSGAIAAAVASVAGVGVVPTLIGIAAFALAVWLGTQRRNLGEVRACQAGLTLNSLVRAEIDLPAAVLVTIGLAATALLVVTSLLRRKRRLQRHVIRGALVGSGVIAVVGIGLVVAAQGARGDAAAAQDHIATGIERLRDGDYEQAAEQFDAAADKFRDVADAMGAPWAQPARLVPIMAQNRQAISIIADRSAQASADLTAAALTIDPDDLRVVDGRIDLDALDEIGTTLSAAYDSMSAVRSAIDDVTTPWLVGPVRSRLDDAATEFDENIDRVDSAVAALELAPAILGADEPRRYFIAFTTPAEARGVGGFMGNYAVLTADRGEVSMTEFGRTGDLNRAASGRRITDAPADWASMWGSYGFTSGPDGTTGDVPWSNITISPHFPSTGAVIAELFPQSGGSEIDGVFALDPYVVQALVRFTGPIDVDLGGGVTRQLTAGNTARFLIFDQYTAAEDNDTRVDALEQVASTVIDELLGGALPGLSQLADTMGPLLDERRLVGWMAEPDEQALLTRVDVDGGLLADDDAGDGFQVVVNNAAANKLDAWLRRSIGYEATVYPTAGLVRGEIEVTLTNEGPTGGLPDGVIDNYLGDPLGTNRSIVTIYSPHRVVSVHRDGQPIDFQAGVEAGLDAATVYLVLPPGESTTLTALVAGVLEPAPDQGPPTYSLTVRTQPLVIPAEYRIGVLAEDGTALVSHSGSLPGTTTFRPFTSVTQ